MSGQVLAALYARVSTSAQDADAQLVELRALARLEGWIIVTSGADVAHGNVGLEGRPTLARLLLMADAGEIDVLAVSAVDRLARDVMMCATLMKRMDEAGVRLVSAKERVGEDPTGRLILHVMAGVAEWERQRIRSRVVAGLAAARARGQILGRPRRAVDMRAVRTLLAEGYGMGDAARAMGIGRETLRRRLAADKASP